MMDQRQRRNDGNKIEEVGAQVGWFVPAKSAASKELNSKPNSESDIDVNPSGGYSSVRTEDPDWKQNQR